MTLVSKLFCFLWFFIVLTEVFGHLSRPLSPLLRLWVRITAVLFLTPFTLNSSSLPIGPLVTSFVLLGQVLGGDKLSWILDCLLASPLGIER